VVGRQRAHAHVAKKKQQPRQEGQHTTYAASSADMAPPPNSLPPPPPPDDPDDPCKWPLATAEGADPLLAVVASEDGTLPTEAAGAPLGATPFGPTFELMGSGDPMCAEAFPTMTAAAVLFGAATTGAALAADGAEEAVSG
jgi:hypothetical protein